MRLNNKKLISFILMLLIFLSGIPFNSLIPIPVHSDVVGSTTVIPSGGNPGTAGGVYKMKPAFRVSFIEEEMKSGVKFDTEASKEDRKDLIEEHFSDHFPQMSNSIVFIPPQADTTLTKKLGWYNASTGEIMVADNVGAKLRSTTTNTLKKNAIYEELNGVSIDSLKNDGWKRFAGYVTETECLQMWSYVFNNWASSGWIEQKLKELLGETDISTGPDASQNQKDELIGRYVGLLASLWKLSPEGNQKQNYANAINRVLTNENTAKRPVWLAVDTVVGLTIPAYFSGVLYLPSLSYLEYTYSNLNDYSLNRPAADLPTASKWDTEKIIQHSAQKVINSGSKRKRITDMPYDPDGKNNGFWWGLSGCTSTRLTTEGGVAKWKTSAVDEGIMEAITFKNKHIGFMIAGYNTPRPKFDPKVFGAHTLTVDPATKVISTPTIGQNTNLEISLDLNSDKAGNDWAEKLKLYDVKFSVLTERSINGSAFTPHTLLETETWNPLYTTDGTPRDMLDETLGYLIKGNYSLKYTDNTKDIAVAANSSIDIEYRSTVKVQLYQNAVLKETVDFSTTTKIATYSRKVKPPGKVVLSATPDNEQLLYTQETIGQSVNVLLDFTQDSTVLDTWLALNNGKTNMKLKVNITRTLPSGGVFNTDKPWKDEVTADITEQEIKDLLNGDLKLSYEDDSMINTSIALNETKKFTYEVSAHFVINGDTYELSGTSDNASFTRPDTPPVKYLGRYGITASPTNIKIVKTAKIADFATIVVEAKQTDKAQFDEIKDFIKGRSDIQIALNLTRDVPGAIFTKTSSPLSSHTAVDNYVNLSESELLSILNGNTLLGFTDNLTNIDIAEDETKAFVYTTGIRIKITGTGQELILSGDPPTATVKYYRPKPELASYISSPQHWSEFKQGTPLNESFEAMAGVPTTRNMYFASGGSEFIVDIEAEYVPTATSNRTYRSYYGGTPCEFKAGDTAPNQTLGGQSANLHNGGTYTKTWTGSIPNKATAVTALHSATCPAIPDYTAYNAALSEANTFASQVNSTVLSFTSASDKQTRTKSGWGAAVSPSPSPPQSTSASVSCSYTAPSGDPPSGGTPCGNEMATANPGGAGSYTITVTWTVPAHVICGPCCQHDLPSIEHNWSQQSTYDYMKINKIRVWKLVTSKLNGLKSILGLEEVTATIQAGSPNVFHNIASSNTSAAGRLRYSLETDQHDAVYWGEGTRTNKCNKQSESWGTGIIGSGNYNYLSPTAKDLNTTEYKKFKARRETLTNVTAISDFVILQTSSGDQSVLYFHKTSSNVKTEEPLAVPLSSKEAMWDNNINSAAKWQPDHINIGSYNSKYTQPFNKYNAGGGSTVATIFDALPAGKIRLARPASGLRLYTSGLDIIDTIRNGEYKTGQASVFYQLIVNSGAGNTPYSTSYNGRFGANGQEYKSTYSDYHSKVNDIVIHNPVSTEFSMVIPLASSRDQRTTSTQALGGGIDSVPDVCPGNAAECDFRILNCTYDGGFEHTEDCYTVINQHGPNNVHNHTDACFGETTTGETVTFNYTGSVQTFVAPYTGVYTLEAWGAQGGSATWSSSTGSGGLGGYSKGSISLNQGETIYVFVGGQGSSCTSGSVANGGYNGGGSGYYYAGGGGGASDIRRGGQNLNNRVIVSGGGGGAQAYSSAVNGGAGGGTSGGNGQSTGHWSTAYICYGGSQSAGGSNTSGWNSGGLGAGGNYYSSYIGGGGGGYYGGAPGAYHGYSGAGGSGYISGLTNASMQSGTRSGNGQIKITKQTMTGISNVLGLISSTANGTWTNQGSFTSRLGNIGLYGQSTRVEGMSNNPLWSNSGYGVSDVLVSSNYIYVVHMNMNWVSQYNKNSDGSFGSLIRSNSWYDYDSNIAEIHRSSSSVPSAFAVITEAGQDKLVGWSMDNPRIYVWNLNNNQPSGRTSYNAPTSIAAYSRGGWDGDRYIYFFNRNNNGLYRWDIQNKSTQPANIVTLTNGANYMSSSWTGSGLLVDTAANEVYGSSGSNQNNGFLTGWNLTTGALLTEATHNPWIESDLSNAGVAIINGGTGHISLTALHRNIGYYFSNYYGGLTQLNLGTIAYNSNNRQDNVSEIRELLGDAFQNVFGLPKSIHAITFSGTDTKGFASISNCSLSVNSNKLLFNITGTDPKSEIPVAIEAGAISEIRVVYDNNTSGVSGEMFFKNSMDAYNSDKKVIYSMSPNTANQTAILDVSANPNWTGDINSLRFDFSEASSGNVAISRIEFWGYGKVISTGGSTGQVSNYSYTGNYQTFTAPYSGTYKLEVWGAQGGDGTSYSYQGGKGGYSTGEVTLSSGQSLYIYVGGQGGAGSSGGWNGGGAGGDSGHTGAGGGATDIRTLSGSWNTNLSSRLIVAGGGGGIEACWGGSHEGGHGGGISGLRGYSNQTNGYGTGASQSSGGYDYYHGNRGYGGFGYGGDGGSISTCASGGGGGYYGGGASYGGNAGGGSGYIGGVQNGQTIAGNAIMPSQVGGTQTGQIGNGYAKITALVSNLKIEVDLGISASTSASGSQNFPYTGNLQTFTAPETGKYTFEVWGAQGGTMVNDPWGYNKQGGLGGYSKGEIELTKGQTAYVYVGGQGSGAGNTQNWISLNGGWNGGGNTYTYGSAASGGGATDVRVNGQGLNNRIIVAGGGGGAGYHTEGQGGYGGGTAGQTAQSHPWGNGAGGGSQTTGGTGGATHTNGSYTVGNGTLGNGGQGVGNSVGGGGGGGGYYGGQGGYISSGAGGSGYIGGVTNAQTIAGNSTMPSPGGSNETGHAGNGYAKVTWAISTVSADMENVESLIRANASLIPDYLSDGTTINPIWTCNLQPKDEHVCDENCIDTTILNCTEPHHYGNHYELGNEVCYDPCNDDSKHNDPKTITLPGGAVYSPGNFINAGYTFYIYFPNRGDFYGDNSLGIGSTKGMRGRGYSNDMNTTEWTASKTVSFQINVIYDNQVYLAGEEIQLPVNQETYTFECPIANSEAINSEVTFRVTAINAPAYDADSTANKTRYTNLDARHSGLKMAYIDVVGRIGNLVIEDTGDFRFSNLFKEAKSPTEWFIENVVKVVYQDRQNQYVGSGVDIIGNMVGANTNYLDTFSVLPHLRKAPILFPLSPEKNNIVPLKKQPLRLGYKVFGDIQTIGNYDSHMQIIMYYYHLDLTNGTISPVDVYINADNQYKSINLFDAAVSGWDPSILYNYNSKLSWDDEYARRNYKTLENTITEGVCETYANVDINGIATSLTRPVGKNYILGNAQIMYPTESARTFVGSSTIYGQDKNPGDRLAETYFNKQAQRWHFTFGLPSSAVFVKKGQTTTQANIDALRNNNGVIIAAADIKAIGSTYVLQYKHPDGNQPIVLGGNSFATSSIPHSVLAVYSANKSSADDLSTSGTH